MRVAVKGYREGVLQIPVILEVPIPYTGKDHRAIGVRCPRCCKREIVYNGNYFCAGFDDNECRWALPDGDPVQDSETFDYYTEPKPLWDLVDMIIAIGCAGGRRGSRW